MKNTPDTPHHRPEASTSRACRLSGLGYIEIEIKIGIGIGFEILSLPAYPAAK